MASKARDTRDVIVSPAAAERLARATTWMRQWPAAAEVLVVAASWEAADDFVRALALTDGARFGTARYTLATLAGVLATPALAAAGRVPLGGLSLDAVAARAVHALTADGDLGYFAPVAACPGFPRAVARTIDELRMHGVALEGLARLDGVGPALRELAAAVERELVAAGAADRAAVFAAACEAVARGEVPSSLLGVPLLLLDVPVATAREADLVAALARRAPAVLATVPAGDEATIARLGDALAAPHAAAPSGERSLDLLQRHLFAAAPPERKLDESVAVRSWPGEARECVEIARAIQQEAARGVPFDRMAIFLPAQHDYTSQLAEALRRATIPAFFASGTSRPDPGGRALLALLACAAEGLSARRFAEYMSLAQVPEPEVQRIRAAAPDRVWAPPAHDLVPPVVADAVAVVPDAPAADPLPDDPARVTVVAGSVRAPWRWERLLVDAAVIGRKERWATRLDGLEKELRLRRAELAREDEARAARLDQEIADLGHLREFALPLIGRLADLPARASWGAWLDHLRGLAAAALRAPEHVLGALAELAPMAPVGPIDLDEVRLVLAERLGDLRERPPRRRYGAVFVAPALGARGLAFDVVFVAGLAERIVPRKITEDPILLDRARAALDATLPRQPERVAAERLTLRVAVGAARERLVLSYPRLDMEQGRPRVPSVYTLDAVQAAEGRLLGFEEIAARTRDAASARLGWPAPEHAADAIDDAEYDLALLAGVLHDDADTTRGTARYLLGANVHLARALRTRWFRWWPRKWTAADGLVEPDELATAALSRHQLGARSFSPTALQNFAACPYRFLLQAVHRLQPRDEPVAIEEMDPLTRGALFHDVQFALLTKLRADGALPVRPETRAQAQDAVDGVLLEVAGRYRELLAPAISRVWEDAIGGIRADLREWLRLASEDDSGWVPYRFELSFGLAERERANADPASTSEAVPIVGGLALRGAIDLVERQTRGRLRVTDHKTGKVRARPDVVVGGGEILQPVLYALACERLLPEPVVVGRLYYCTATGGFEERVVEIDDRARAAAAEVVAILDRALARGFLPAAPAARACEYCDYRPICGPYEEIRARRKPADGLQDLARLRSMP
ncbi:MAG TPA: PD-(D/E)XK nuclease family protein [Candidatus Binatia bacterium]